MNADRVHDSGKCINVIHHSGASVVTATLSSIAAGSFNLEYSSADTARHAVLYFAYSGPPSTGNFVPLYVSGLIPPTISGNVGLHIPGHVERKVVEEQPDQFGRGYFHHRGSFAPSGLFNRGFFSLNEGTGSLIYSDQGVHSGIFKNHSNLSFSPEWLNYYKSGPLSITLETEANRTGVKNYWRNAVYMSSGAYIDFLGSVKINPNNFTIYFQSAPSGNLYREGHFFYTGNPSFPGNGDISIGWQWFDVDNIEITRWDGLGGSTILTSDADTLRNGFAVSVAPSGSSVIMTIVTQDNEGNIDVQSSSPLTPVTNSYRNLKTGAGTAVGIPNENVKFFLHEFGVSDSGIYQGNANWDYFNDWVNSYHNNHSYVSNSGDAKYIQWKVPSHTGVAYWSNTYYGLPQWIGESGVTYQLSGPSRIYETNTHIVPSAIYVQIQATHITNHPSGAWVRPTIKLYHSSPHYEEDPVIKEWYTEVLIPSGTSRRYIAGPIINSNDEFNNATYHIRMQDLYNPFNLVTLETRYDGTASNYDGDLRIEGLNIVFDTYATWASGANYVPMSLTGENTATNNFPLFLHSQLPTSGLSLYIVGHTPINSGLSLYTTAGTSVNSGISIYVSGQLLSTNTAPLFTKGPTPGYVSGQVPLNIFSTTNSGLFSQFNLVLMGADFDQRQALNLFVAGTPEATTSNMNLFTKCDQTLNNLVNLFIPGPSGISENFTLFLKAPSGTLGAIPVSNNIPLYIARDSEGVMNRISLFVKTSEPVNSGINVFIEGAPTGVNNNATLYVSGTHVPTNSFPCFVSGF
jgi:hypothetical protein